MAEAFIPRLDDLARPADHAASVTPSDTVDLTTTARALYIGTGGDVNVSSLDLQADTGVTCTVPANGVKLSRDTWSDPAGHSLLNIVTPHLYWVASGAANTYKRPFMRGDTDGRRSLDEADYTRVVGVPIIMTPETIEELLDAVNASDSGVVRNPGWTCTIDAGIDVADGSAGTDWDPNLLNRNRYASWVEGGGIAYVAGEWRYPLDRDVSSAQTLVAQVLCDKVKIYPMCGDVFGLRTGADRWAVYGEDGSPYEGARATVTERPSGADAGYGDSDVRGEYLTGRPGAAHDVTMRTTAEVGVAQPYADGTAYAGLRRRVCFVVTGTALGPIECDSVRQWLHIGIGSRIRTYHMATYTQAFESAEYADIEEWVRFRHEPRRSILLCLGKAGTTHRAYSSQDGGLSGTEVVSVTARTACIERDSERGTFVLMYENSGNVQRRISLDGGDTWESATTPTLSGTTFTGEILDMAQDHRRAVLLMSITTGGTTKVLESYDVGVTWSVAVS